MNLSLALLIILIIIIYLVMADPLLRFAIVSLIAVIIYNKPDVLISLHDYVTSDAVNSSTTDTSSGSTSPVKTTESFAIDENPLPYGEERSKYTDSYSLAYPQIRPITALGPDEITQNIDNAHTMLWRARTVDKKRSDGWACKDVNYYRSHFGDALAYNENKPWWGRSDW